MIEFEEPTTFFTLDEAFDAVYFFEPFDGQYGYIKVLSLKDSPLDDLFSITFISPDAPYTHYRIPCDTNVIHVVSVSEPQIKLVSKR